MAPCLTNDPRAELAELEHEITRVEHLLATLIQRRVPLKRNVNRQCSPMLALPVEICSEIFTTCFPADRVGWGPGTPLVLGSVCTAWRNLAWSMPWLWNTVHLSTPSLTEYHAHLLHEWISRSGHLPLSITMHVAKAAPVHAVPLMDVLAACSKRWRTIDLDVPFFFPQHTSFCNLVPTSVPLLTSASIKADSVPTSPLHFFLSAPHLTRVSLRNLPPHAISLPHHQITHLHLSPTTVQECLSVLASFPNLTHCTLEDITRSDVVNPVPILAPSLVSLTVISFTHTPLSELLDTLLLPSASDLSFHVTGNTFSPWSFVSLIIRSSCVLQRLYLNGVRLSERQLWDCLQAVPSLVSLSLTNMARITDDTIRVLNPLSQARLLGPDAPCVLPLLQELDYTGFLPISLAEVAAALDARWSRSDDASRLRKVRFANHTDAEVDQKQVARIAQLARDGMDVSLVTGDLQWI